MGQELDGLLRFTALLHDFRAVERRILCQGSARQENDTEHSYALAMLAWYPNESQEGPLFGAPEAEHPAP
jgi:5'-deoxynucleotidase YfbR-like HD superfamily hydrolase